MTAQVRYDSITKQTQNRNMPDADIKIKKCVSEQLVPAYLNTHSIWL